MSLFVSYTHSDEVIVRAVKDDLEQIGRPVWLDHQIHGGERWWHEIIQQIQAAELLVFALSDASWRSRPCRAELAYAEQLGVPVIPVQVGPVDSPYISLAEKQIIDYRNRDADAVLALMAAVNELSAQPRQLPDPMPEPPKVPFEYLYRIASLMDVQSIPPEMQGRLIDELRRKLKEEYDDLAKSDILKLLKQLRDRKEVTVPHAAEINEILEGVEAKKVPPPTGGTRLPPERHWRQDKAKAEQDKAKTEAVRQAEDRKPANPWPPSPPAHESSSPSGNTRVPPGTRGSAAHARAPSAPRVPPAASPRAPSAEPPSTPQVSPATSSWAPHEPRAGSAKTTPASEPRGAPFWLADIIARGGASNTGTALGRRAAGVSSSAQKTDQSTPSRRTRKWWPEEPKTGSTGPTPRIPPPAPSTPGAASAPHAAAARRAPSERRFAFAGVALGMIGIPFLVVSVNGDAPPYVPIITTLLLFLSTLGFARALVGAARREPRSRVAMSLEALGLVGAITGVVIALLF